LPPFWDIINFALLKTPRGGTKMGKILMVAPTSFFSDYGCHVRIYEEIKFLQREGFKVVVYAYKKGGEAPGVEIRRIPSIPGDNRYELGASWIKVAFDFLLALKVLAGSLREKFDLVHAHLHEGALIGSVAARLLRVPLVFDFQGSLTDEMIQHGILKSNGWLFRLMWGVEKFIDHLPDAVITSSLHGAKLLVEKFGCNPVKVFTIHDCVNVEAFRPRTPKDEEEVKALKGSLGIPQDLPVVVYLGLLSSYQGVDILLKAASILLRNGLKAHFLIMGFPSENYYKAIAEALGIGEYVTFTGRIPYFKAPSYLRLGDLAVAPKLSASEGNGKLLVYMATGLPIVAFDRPVNREYLGELGIYAAPGDPTSLAEALGNALNNLHELKSVGEALRMKAVENYRWEKAGEMLLQIYRKVGLRGGWKS
jgi:glycosyltransferase involved in cell wall biosynthesis